MRDRAQRRFGRDARQAGVRRIGGSVCADPSSPRQRCGGCADETSWRQAGDSRWLSVAAAIDAALFQIAIRRDRDATRALLGDDPNGVIVSDRYSVYLYIDASKRHGTRCGGASGEAPPSSRVAGAPTLANRRCGRRDPARADPDCRPVRQR